MTSKPRRRSPATAKRYDVGDGEMMTVREIATFLSTSPGTIQGRITKGWTGESLILPPGDRRKKSTPRTRTSVIAYTLALTFGRRVHTHKEIMEVYPMTEATAYYWRHTIKLALERHARLRR